MTPILYAKLGAGLAAVALLFISGWHLGGLSKEDELDRYKTAVEAQHAVQLQAVVDTMALHDKQAARERVADKGVIDAYELDRSLPPATAGLVERMRVVESASCASHRQLPDARPLAGGPDSAGGIPAGPSEADRLLQSALDAAARDAARLNAVVKLAPQP